MRSAVAPLFLLLMSLSYAVSAVLSLKRHSGTGAVEPASSSGVEYTLARSSNGAGRRPGSGCTMRCKASCQDSKLLLGVVTHGAR